jgi:hypothetical protein
VIAGGHILKLEEAHASDLTDIRTLLLTRGDPILCSAFQGCNIIDFSLNLEVCYRYCTMQQIAFGIY